MSQNKPVNTIIAQITRSLVAHCASMRVCCWVRVLFSQWVFIQNSIRFMLYAIKAIRKICHNYGMVLTNWNVCRFVWSCFFVLDVLWLPLLVSNLIIIYALV